MNYHGNCRKPISDVHWNISSLAKSDQIIQIGKQSQIKKTKKLCQSKPELAKIDHIQKAENNLELKTKAKQSHVNHKKGKQSLSCRSLLR